MAAKNKYPKNRAGRLPDKGAQEHYEREKVYLKSYKKMLDRGQWVVIGCEDHVYVGRIWPGTQHMVDAALMGFWPIGTLIANQRTGQIVSVNKNGKGFELEITPQETLTEIQRRRYRDYTSYAK